MKSQLNHLSVSLYMPRPQVCSKMLEELYDINAQQIVVLCFFLVILAIRFLSLVGLCVVDGRVGVEVVTDSFV
jgi:hypothetical protein